MGPLLILDKLASRAAKFLAESPDPQGEMRWAEDRLFQANLFNGNQPPRNKLWVWAQQVIAENPDVRNESLPWLKERDSHPEEAETFENLILSLIPSEGGL